MIFLSADAFGVLPPVALLNNEQAKYCFLSGFTAKLAGTERAASQSLLPHSRLASVRHSFLCTPQNMQRNLRRKMSLNGAKAYLVNTGWNGTGKRISIPDTRGIIDDILNGDIEKAPTKVLPYFDFVIPTELPGVNTGILDPATPMQMPKNGMTRLRNSPRCSSTTSRNSRPTKPVRLSLRQVPTSDPVSNYRNKCHAVLRGIYFYTPTFEPDMTKCRFSLKR